MKFLKRILSRIVIVGLLIALQVIWVVVVMHKLIAYSIWIDIILKCISLTAVLILVGKEMNPAVKLAWVVPILAFPLFGGLMYLLLYERKPTKHLRRELENSDKRIMPLLTQDFKILKALDNIDRKYFCQEEYIRNYSGFPMYNHTKTVYFKSGEENYEVLLNELKRAEHFIFMEYFILRDGVMWNSIFEILKQKAREGLDVRLIYDDVGSLMYLPYRYYEEVEQYGIRCEAFNHFVPYLSVVMNHRDHRKITVIDGHTGFTGGINLGDEYINLTHEYGYWKDTGIMLKGEAVWSLTIMFLSLWNGLRPTDLTFDSFRPHQFHYQEFCGCGYVQPYSDTPLDDENVGENVYLNMILASEYYIYIFNPYLIIDNEMMTALCLAAKRGVDVRIVTPGVSDSKVVFWLADSYFPQLTANGVKVYMYNPGFIHAKVFLCDDKAACVGTFNMDYRSLYLHFECGVFLYKTESISSIKEDMLETLKQSTLLTQETLKRSLSMRFCQRILRVIAPLL